MDVSYHMIMPSQDMATRITRLMEKMIESRVSGNQFSWTGFTEARLAHAATPSVLNSIDPIMVPRPISESATKVLIIFVKNSGVVDASDINVAAATSYQADREWTELELMGVIGDSILGMINSQTSRLIVCLAFILPPICAGLRKYTRRPAKSNHCTRPPAV